MKFKPYFLAFSVLCIFLLSGCGNEKTLFVVREANETGLHFNNKIQAFVNDTLNALKFEYIYNGGGLGAGDLNNDGLTDLYFAGNFVSGKLFLNKGNLKFEDVTEKSKTTTDKWCTGVSIVDINQDGWNDIYLCVAGPHAKEKRGNLLFINQGLDKNGVPVFKEEAEAYGIADTGYSTMGAFFDYDKDGDLDLYLLTNNIEKYNRNNLRKKLTNGEAENTDRLYRNNGNNTFSNVSKEAGILIEGWGLGVCIADINQDSWPDVYVANDFLSNELIWINQKDGTFKNKASEYLQHQTHNGMGVDIADYNNDMLPDIVVLDMLPDNNHREKLMVANGNDDQFDMGLDMGYEPQYMRNTLQLNQGILPNGDVKFSEISYMAGVSGTDWSWAPLLADYDNDGLKDLFIANGYRKDVTNLDFISYTTESSMYFGTDETKKQRMKAKMDSLPDVKVHNYIYKNKGNLTFEDMSEKWGFKRPTFSNGTIYADLDNDGDLDLVSNNIDDEAIVYENTLYHSSNKERPENNFMRLQLFTEKGQPAYGSKVCLSINGKKQFIEFTTFRGYKSTVEPYLHFGLGNAQKVDTLTIIWSDNRITQKINVKVNQVIKFNIKESFPDKKNNFIINAHQTIESNHPFFREITALVGLDSVFHIERDYNDYKSTPLLHRKLSKDGPYIAVGDLNGDGLDDFVLGADAGESTRIFYQKTNTSFEKTQLPFDKESEDRGILIFDADKDGDNDIYIVSGGSQFPKESSKYQDRLYLNDGKGNFIKGKLPKITSSGSVVKAFDYDKDGDLDLFVGSRLVPQAYPYLPKSHLLRNDEGKFTDVSSSLPEQGIIGMVSDAVCADYDKDGLPDLVLVGEWMPVTVLKNSGKGTFMDMTKSLGLDKTNGWYHSVASFDINKDGYPELILGNNGTNSYYKASEKEPLEIFAKDFDKNGSIDPIMTHYNFGKRYISFYRDRLINQIVSIKKRFLNYETFADATFEASFTKDELEGAYHGYCYTLSSFILENVKSNSFKPHILPNEVQFAPVNAFIEEDIDHDGKPDLVGIGNSFAEESIRGRYDASYGLCLLNKTPFNYQTLKPSVSGFVAEGDTKQIQKITISGKPCYLITRNNGKLSVLTMSGEMLSLKGELR